MDVLLSEFLEWSGVDLFHRFLHRGVSPWAEPLLSMTNTNASRASSLAKFFFFFPPPVLHHHRRRRLTSKVFPADYGTYKEPNWVPLLGPTSYPQDYLHTSVLAGRSPLFFTKFNLRVRESRRCRNRPPSLASRVARHPACV